MVVESWKVYIAYVYVYVRVYMCMYVESSRQEALHGARVIVCIYSVRICVCMCIYACTFFGDGKPSLKAS